MHQSILTSATAPAAAESIELAVRVEGVTKRYGELAVLKGVDFSMPAGQFVAVMGKSGSGKSTLLGIIAGLEQPDAGEAFVMGRKLSGLSDRDMAQVRRRSIGIVFQQFSLIPSLDALDNVLLPTYFTGQDPTEIRQRAVGLLKQVEMGERLHNRPSALSGGEQQRVAIARALINRPAVVLADEPTGNLDQATGASVLDLLIGLVRTSRTSLLMVTHDADVASRSSKIVEMKDGKIVDGQA